MFNPHADPVANVPVYKRIALNEPRPAAPSVGPSTWEICDALVKRHEAERIWQIVRETAIA